MTYVAASLNIYYKPCTAFVAIVKKGKIFRACSSLPQLYLFNTIKTSLHVRVPEQFYGFESTLP